MLFIPEKAIFNDAHCLLVFFTKIVPSVVGEGGTLSFPKKIVMCRLLFSLLEWHLFATACHDRLFLPCLVDFWDNTQMEPIRDLFLELSASLSRALRFQKYLATLSYMKLCFQAPEKGIFGFTTFTCPTALLCCPLFPSAQLFQGSSGMDIILQLIVWLHSRYSQCCCPIS